MRERLNYERRVYYTQTCIGTLGRTNTSASVRSAVCNGSGKVEDRMGSTTTTMGVPR